VQFAENLDQLLVDPFIDGGMLGDRQLVESGQASERGINARLPAGFLPIGFLR
jgi:hypothetical protein